MSNPSQIGSIIGLVAGAALAVAVPGVGAAVGIGLAASIGSLAGGLAGSIYMSATAPDSRQEQQSLADLHVQSSALGGIIPQIVGEFGNIAGNIIWATDKVEHEHRETQKSGGKGGGPKNTTITKTYTVSLAIAFADTRLTGPVEFVQIFRNYTLVYDSNATASGEAVGFSITTPGNSYAVNDTGGLGGGNNNADYIVTSVDGGGGVTGLTITNPGSGYHDGDVCHLHRGGAQEGVGNHAEITLSSVVSGSLPDGWTFYTGTSDQSPDPTIEATEGVGQVPGYHYLAYIVMADEDLGSAGVTPNFTATLRQQGSNELIDVLPMLLAPCGLDESLDLDLTELEPEGIQTDVSLAIVARQQVKALIDHLGRAYRFYVIESGTTLKFRQLESGERFFDIPEIDTDTAEERSQGQGAMITRTDTIALPTELDVGYIDAEQNYQGNTQRAQRTIAVDEFNEPQSLSLPLVLESNTAKVDACELLYNAWIGRESLHTTLGRKWAFLEPGDRGYVTVRGVPYGITLTEVGYGRPGLVEITGHATASVCAPFIRGLPVAAPGETPQDEIDPLLPPGDTTGYLLNLPSLTSSDYAPRYHVGYLGDDTSWPGAVLYRSLDGGASYAQIDNGFLELITGVSTDIVDDVDWHFLDTTTTITVELDKGELSSISDLALYNGGNLCVIGDEIIGFGVATLTATLTYELTRLLRGRRGTEWAVGLHGAVERFVYLDAGARAVAMSMADKNVTRPYKTVTLGQDIADVTSQDFAPTAANLNPYSVASPSATLDGSDWVLAWRYRSRFAGDWVDASGVGYDIDANGYEVRIYSDATYATLKRSTLTDGGTPLDPEAVATWTYTDAMQTADFGSSQSTIYYRVYQITNAGISVADDLVGA